MLPFTRFIAVDYSGAGTPECGLPGVRVYVVGSGELRATEVRPPHARPRHWSRRTLAEWIIERIGEDFPTLIGIDHGFSLPLAYVQAHGLPHAWPELLDDFCAHWPCDARSVRVAAIRRGEVGRGALRSGSARWRRRTEIRAGAKSVFHFGVPGSVAMSTHAGLPWLRHIRRTCGKRVHIWPFEGFGGDRAIDPSAVCVLAEIYPSNVRGAYDGTGLTPDQHDAFAAAMWLRDCAADGRLTRFLHPALSDEERAIAETEGWILGVEGAP